MWRRFPGPLPTTLTHVTALEPSGTTAAVEQADYSDRLARATTRDVLAAYVGLTKPRIIELLLLTTVPVMFLAARGVPDVWLVVATVVGGTLSAGSANALNQPGTAAITTLGMKRISRWTSRMCRRPRRAGSTPPEPSYL